MIEWPPESAQRLVGFIEFSLNRCGQYQNLGR
jgi:hypothetical protein